jgi:hypothetical protein
MAIMTRKRRRRSVSPDRLKELLGGQLREDKRQPDWVRHVARGEDKVVVELEIDRALCEPSRVGGRRRNQHGRKPLGWDEGIGKVPLGRKTVRRMVTLEHQHIHMLRKWGRLHGAGDNVSKAMRLLIETAMRGELGLGMR